MKRGCIYMKLFAVLFIFFFASVCAANTLLVGFDSALVTSTCYITNSTSIEDGHWKAFHMQALASGTISYFKMGISYAPTGCTNDSGCWAIYDGTSGSNTVGNLKAYGCFTGYNWTTLGISQEHAFNVTNTETNLTVTRGNWYWVVFWSYAVDYTNYTTAGCSAYPYTQRGRAGACQGTMDYMQSATHLRASSPPAGTAFTIPVMSYFAWGVWSSSGETPPSPPTNLRVQ